MTQPGDELGPFTQVRLVHHAAVVDLFCGVDQAGRPVVMVALTPEAGVDPAWRGAFGDLVNRDRATVGPADPQFVAAHAGELQGARPWVASRFEPGRRGVERILHVIPQAVPPGADPTAMVGAALGAAQAPQWAPPGQPQAAAFGAPPVAPYGVNGYPGGPHPGPQPGQPAPAGYPQAGRPDQNGYPGQQVTPPAQAGPPAAEQYSPPVSSAPFPTPVSATPQSGVPQSGVPQSGVPQQYSAPPQSSPFSDPFSSPIGQSGPPQSGPPASAPPMSDPYSAPLGQPSGIPDQFAAPVSGEPRQSGYQSGGYPGEPDQSRGYYSEQGSPAYADPAAPYESDKTDGSSRRGAGMLIGLITAVTALVIVAAGFAVVFIKGSDDKPSKPVAAKSPSTSALPAETAGATPTPTKSPLPSTTPTIRDDVETTSIVGPTWQNEDKTQLLDLRGWPFAFRLPEGWSCLTATAEGLPDANAWACVKTEGTSHQQKFNLMLRRCPTGCIATEQATMNEEWFEDDEEAVAKKADATTTYAEIPKNSGGFYVVSASHFLADKPGGTLTYQVGVWFQSPDKYKEEMQKALNDVRTQAPQP